MKLLDRWRSTRTEMAEYKADKRRPHDIEDFDCRFWTGDRAGFRMGAVCKVCAADGGKKR